MAGLETRRLCRRGISGRVPVNAGYRSAGSNRQHPPTDLKFIGSTDQVHQEYPTARDRDARWGVDEPEFTIFEFWREHLGT